MSEQHPPAGGSSYDGPGAPGSTPDYGRSDLPTPPPDTVTLGGGAWNDPKGDRRGRRWWYVGGGAVAAIALVAGGSVFAATQLRAGHDAGSAAGLPSDTLMYAGVDLNPNAGQKIEAIKALREFPAFTHGLKLDPSVDLRKLFLEDELAGDGCSLDWGKDVAPWLGHDVGAALVPGDGKPEPVAVLAVDDEAAARKELPKLLDCAHAPHGLSIANGWAVIASSDSVATSVSAAAKSDSLADDDDFTTWADRTGDPGVVTFYASEDAGSALADHIDQLTTASGSASSMSRAAYAPRGRVAADGLGTAIDPADPTDPFSTLLGMCPGALSGRGGPAAPGTPDTSPLQEQKKALAGFKGGAATLRFSGGGFELESASRGEGAKASGGTTGLATLPDDTSFAFGSATGRSATHWIDTFTDTFAQGIAQQCGTQPDRVLQGITELTGLTLPDDLDTLLGRGVTLAASGSIDPEALANSTTPSDLAVGLKLQGDPDKIAAVLRKITLPGADEVLGTTDGDGVVAVGPDADYRAELVKDGSLGGTEAFTDVVPHADKATSALYVSFDSMRKLWDSDALGIPADVRANLGHLQAFGASTWVDDGFTHGLMRLSTR